MGCLLLNELLSVCSMTVINHKISVARRFLRAVGRGWKCRCGGFWVPVHAGELCWAVSLQNSALVGTGTGFHGRKPQDSTPGIFAVLRLAFSQWGAASPHPSCVQMQQNYGKTALIACPSVLPWNRCVC